MKLKHAITSAVIAMGAVAVALLYAPLPTSVKAQDTRPVKEASPQLPPKSDPGASAADPRQIKEETATTLAPSGRTFRDLRSLTDAKAANAQLEAYKRKKQGELKKIGSQTTITQATMSSLAVLAPITLVADGNTTLSPGCELKLTATTPPNGHFYSWVLKNNTTSQSYYLGETDNPVTSMSVVLVGGTGSYIIECTTWIYDYAQDKLFSFGPFPSNAVNVSFSGPPGGNLHAVSLNTYSVKGGNNYKEPTMTVYLDGPAPSCGQKVYLTTSNSYAWIHGTKYFVIAGGQTNDSISWFVGTANVSKNRHVDIIAWVKGTDGHAKLEVRK